MGYWSRIVVLGAWFDVIYPYRVLGVTLVIRGVILGYGILGVTLLSLVYVIVLTGRVTCDLYFRRSFIILDNDILDTRIQGVHSRSRIIIRFSLQ